MPGKSTHFHLTDSGEPHAIRRVRLLRAHPEVRALFGTDPFTAVVTVLVFAAQLGCAWGVARGGERLEGGAFAALLLGSAYLVGSILNHWLAMTVHECSHYLVFRNKNANRWLALFANIPFVFPMAMTFIRYHVGHHALLGVLEEDTDLPHSAEVRTVGRSRVRKFFWVLFNFVFYSGRAFTFMKPLDRWEVLNIFWQIGFTTLLYLIVGPIGLAYLLLSTVFGMSMHPVSAHFIHEHYGFANGQETFSYYGPLNKVAFNVGYHNEHHDLMNIPGSRLPQLRRMAPEFYEGLASHRSWTVVLLEFVFRRDLSLADRIVRTREAFDRGRKALRSQVGAERARARSTEAAS